ncbi:MAG: AAA family ATPase [Firmicutes bacterium]|nr:AAA family ATPase [Bacillota bacterium]
MCRGKTQEKIIHMMTPDGPVVIRYMQRDADTEEALKKKLEGQPHLEQCRTLMGEGASQKVALICETIRQGLDSCHTVVDILGLKHDRKENKNSKGRQASGTEETDDDLKAFFDELEIEWDDDVEEAPKAVGTKPESDEQEKDLVESLCSDPSNFVIFSEKDIDDGACNDLGETMEKMMGKKRAGLAPQACAALIVKCDGITALSEETIEFVLSQEEKPVILVIPRNKVNHQKIDRLLFEGGFEIVETTAPSDEYLEERFREIVKQMGYEIHEAVDVKGTIRVLKRERGHKFGEGDLELLAKAALKRHHQEHKTGNCLTDISTPHYTTGKSTGRTMLDKIVGLENVKTIIETEINRQAYRSYLMEELNRSGDVIDDYIPCRNMAFCGNPGTCKTTMARAMAARMGELGVTNGTFLEVSREHLVGRYMGETSLKVAGIFEKARGGVLFIDEAGSLAGDGSDRYSEEAVSAIVRHMENERDTVVIFATYKDDMERLMAVNEGLRSRIGRMVHFADYTPEQLTEIFCSMASSRGYHVEKGAEALLTDYFEKAAERKDFGAGREARRLLDQTEGQMANLAMRSGFSGAQLRLLTIQVISEAAGILLGETKEKRRAIGFAPRPAM